MKRVTFWLLALLAVLSLLAFAASGCRPEAAHEGDGQGEREDEHEDEMPALSAIALSEGERLKVVATTSIVADVVGQVGGDLIDLRALMPLGTDPHAFEPTPQDAAAVADAHVVFVNGAGLEAFLEPLLESAGDGVTVVPVSHGVELFEFRAGSEDGDEGTHDHGSTDPHTWFDPNNVMVWTGNIEHTLSTLDPDNADKYGENAQAYEADLKELDAWIREQLAQVPAENRKLVTDHTSFRYLVQRYGLEQVGAVFPGYSTLDEPSAKDIAALEDAIREFGVQAVFVGLTVNPDLAQRVADDTGIRLVYLYAGSLSEADGPADDYVSLMKYNVSAIVGALR